jgi:hypothetical protein
VHLGMIMLHPLHSPPFVRMCFTPKHAFGLMDPYISILATNPVLRMQQNIGLFYFGYFFGKEKKMKTIDHCRTWSSNGI